MSVLNEHVFCYTGYIDILLIHIKKNFKKGSFGEMFGSFSLDRIDNECVCVFAFGGGMCFRTDFTYFRKITR